MLCGLHAGQDIGNHLVAANKRDGGPLLGRTVWVVAAAFIAGASASTTTARRLAPLLSWC